MTWEVVWTGPARADIRRLDQQVAQRVFRALQRYAETGSGNVVRLRGVADELRLRVGDWRVRFREETVLTPTEPTATGETSVRVITVLRVLPRDQAYRD